MAAHIVELSCDVDMDEAFLELFGWASAIPDRLPLKDIVGGAYYDGDEAVIMWPASQTRIVTEGATMARGLGFLVEETERGWVAIAPSPYLWAEAGAYGLVGACEILSVTRCRWHEQDIIRFHRQNAHTREDVWTLEQYGWHVASTNDGDTIRVTYTFDGALAALAA